MINFSFMTNLKGSYWIYFSSSIIRIFKYSPIRKISKTASNASPTVLDISIFFNYFMIGFENKHKIIFDFINSKNKKKK